LYDEIMSTLKEKFTIDQKIKMAEMTKQMRASLEEKVKELTHSHECAINRLNQKNTSLTLQLALKDQDIEGLHE
jgi:uncharacterized membrane protein (DUF106 family)